MTGGLARRWSCYVPVSYVGFGLLVDRVLLFGLVGFIVLALILRSSYAPAESLEATMLS